MKTFSAKSVICPLLCLYLLLSFPGGLFGQDIETLGNHSNVDPLPQVFTPSAAGLGEYGKVPVSYFNGLPNISIPLTELKGKNYSLPVYLSYHAGGNKPDEHA